MRFGFDHHCRISLLLDCFLACLLDGSGQLVAWWNYGYFFPPLKWNNSELFVGPKWNWMLMPMKERRDGKDLTFRSTSSIVRDLNTAFGLDWWSFWQQNTTILLCCHTAINHIVPYYPIRTNTSSSSMSTGTGFLRRPPLAELVSFEIERFT